MEKWTSATRSAAASCAPSTRWYAATCSAGRPWCEPYKMTGVATASSDTRLVQIEAQPLRDLCEQDPRLGYRLMTQVCRLLGDRLDATRLQLVKVP